MWEQTRTRLARAKDGTGGGAHGSVALRHTAVLGQGELGIGAQFRAGDAANFSIGQGDVATTPLQMGVAYAAIADGGVVRTPRVGVRTVDPVTGTSTPVTAGPTREAALPTAVGDYVRSGLRAVVVSGTAAQAFKGMPGDWPVSGKTGTAEVFDRSDTSWFLSYAPTTRPRDAVSVAVSQEATAARRPRRARSIHEALRLLR